ncbi:PPK2 family polyphosphate kinase [Plastoroseomonas arctica]|uniref:Polyphosphate kinase 2 family protein n=1 Tax=Plastoroseomonas arctica TaxID=1509237 RepID=A0AAF1K7H5_9PROT|nr:PPK2 family polyphosphate kinase [Plastoroseomonas arctica]MBR0657066.1 polyphosphate kinase 2 family protein [Plastoroseomonas arctica]
MEKKIRKLVDRYRVTAGKGFSLRDHDPDDTGGLKLDRADADALVKASTTILAEQQDKLYAQDRWAVLCIFQAMDAAGKDGAVKHVFSGVNPQGCHVENFKAPNALELDHDFLWRHVIAIPRRGTIGIHNRSWYEETLVVRVHHELLAHQKLPPSLITKRIFDERLEDIAAYERYLARQGVVILKFFLHVSKEEQRKRFLERIEEPEKNWKFNAGDVAERAHWKAYHTAYEAAIRATAAPHAPWFVVPADNKRFTRIIIGNAIAAALEDLDLEYPKIDEATRAKLAEARATLE